MSDLTKAPKIISAMQEFGRGLKSPSDQCVTGGCDRMAIQTTASVDDYL